MNKPNRCEILKDNMLTSKFEALYITTVPQTDLRPGLLTFHGRNLRPDTKSK